MYMKNVFLDFDGVMFNSVKEAYILSRYAHSGLDVFSPLDERELAIFTQNRYLIHNSWQYYYIMELLKRRIVDMRNDFTNCMAQRDVKSESTFNDAFIKKRKDLIANHYDFWSSLDEPYSFFFKLKKLNESGDFNFIIVTTKNKLAIEALLKKYNFHISSDKIIGKEHLANYLSKGNFLMDYISKNNIQNSIFVEDNRENLDSCSRITGMTTLLVNWGYVDPEETGLNETEIIERLKQC